MTDPAPASLKIDAASAISQGARDYQEDAFISDFTRGARAGMAVLSDGMGGHAAGDLASKIVVTEVFSELTFQLGKTEFEADHLSQTLRGAAKAANDCLASYVAKHPKVRGMGATLVSCVIINDALHWISIGDSPLFLFRDNALSQLNEDHSLGPHIDFLVNSGALSPEEGQNHPERNALTSVLLGKSIPQIDCPEDGFSLLPGDTLILASDGLQFLSNDAIAQTLRDFPLSQSADLADRLMARVEGLNDPDLDNVTLSVMRVMNNEVAAVADVETAPVSRLPKWPFGRPSSVSLPSAGGAR